MQTFELRTLFTIRTIGSNMTKESLDKIIGIDIIRNLRKKELVDIISATSGNEYYYVTEVGDKIIDRFESLSELI